jgi:hypothetical protein
MTAKELFLEAMRRTDAGEHEGFLALPGRRCPRPAEPPAFASR